MAKFPSHTILNYESGATADGTGTTIGLLNVPYGLSVLNRRGYDMTTRRGVPLVYRCKIDFHRADEDGKIPTGALGADSLSTLTIDGCQNNWVMLEAAKQWHLAREKMYQEAGIKKRDRGAYSHTIRYNFDGASDAWMTPLDSTGTAFTGGTWDATTLSYSGDASFQLSLTGAGDDEESDAFSGAVLSLGHSYLVSRANQQADTNLEAEQGPAKFSVLRRMLAGDAMFANTQDDVARTARNEQDNPPYEVLDLDSNDDGTSDGDTSHDITKEVELGRCVVGYGNNVDSCIVDIPFGICEFNTYFEDAANTDTTQRAFISVKVLKISEMQG